MAIRSRPHLPHAVTDYEGSWEEQLFAVFNGATDKARLGRIPRLHAKAVGASTTVVTVSHSTAHKIRGKHNQITFQDLYELAAHFHEGVAYREGSLHLAYLFKSPDPKRGMIKAVLKATRDGTEIYLKTMHPIAGHKMKAVRAKTTIIG